MNAQNYPVNKKSKDKFWGLKIAIRVSVKDKKFGIGDEVGFSVGKKHFKIIRDN